LHSRTHAETDVLQGAVAASSGPKPVRHMPKARLEDRLQDVLDRTLNYAVTHCRDTEGSELPRLTRLGDQLPSRRARFIPAAPQVALDLFQEQVHTHCRADSRYCHPIDPGSSTPLVQSDLSPGAPQVPDIRNPVPHVAVAVFRMSSAPLIEFALHAEEPGFISLIIQVHGWFLRLHNSVGSLPAFAMYTAFPCANYYAGSAPSIHHLPSPWLARFRCRAVDQGSHVPVLDLHPVGGILYPWRYRATTCE